MNETFANLHLTDLVTSLTNPRKHFNPERLAELTESIKASGVHQPILVRPLGGDRLQETFTSRKPGAPLPSFEIVSGERRYRASVAAGLDVIPAMVRRLTDDQVLEIQIIENLQRSDLTELEEAEGYEVLMQHGQITAEEVAAKIGKSRSYVYSRTKLLDLSMECKDALRAGQIDASRAILIARIPDTKLQIKALAEATRANYTGDVCSVRELQRWLQMNVMLRLDKAQFSIADTRLVESAGSCIACPKRTGANPDLFANVDGTDVCTDPQCFNSKSDAHRLTILATAEAKGLRVMAEADARKACSQYSSHINGYSLLSQRRDDIDGSTLAKLLGKDAPAPVLIENPWTHQLVEAVATDEAEAVLLAKGLIKVGKSKSTGKRDLERDIDEAFRDATLAELNRVIRDTPDNECNVLVSPALVRAWWTRQIDGDIDGDDLAAAFAIPVAPEDTACAAFEDQMHAHIKACPSVELWRALAFYMIMDDKRSYRWQEDKTPTLFAAMAESVGVDIDAIFKTATKDVRATTAKELAKLKAEIKAQEAPKPVVTESPAAQAKPAAGKNVYADGKKSSPRKHRAPATTPEEAMSAISAAMQEVETAAEFPAGDLRNPATPWPYPSSERTGP